MVTIIKINDFVFKILGIQEFNNNLKYRLSKYTFSFNYKNKLILYNTMTKQLVLLNSDEKNCFTSLEEGKNLDSLKTLINNWFLVPEDFDEKNLNDQIIFLAKQTPRKGFINNFVILPTTDCNARCYYCFELGTKRINMDEKTAIDVSNYISKVSKGNKVKLHWFGGEPLYNSNAIDIICSSLKKQNIEYESSMISNAFLFDKMLVKKAKFEWKLKTIQITLDGTEEIYNNTKAYIYKQVKNPFQRVYENIGLLLENDISIKVRLNMDMHNIDNLYELINTLYKDYGKYNKLKIYPAILFEEIGADKKIRTEEQRDIVYSAYIQLCQYLFDKGLLNISPLDRSLKISRCIADNESSVVVLPNGELCKCEHYSESEIFGNIYNESINHDIIESWKEKKEEIPECFNCLYYPNCLKLKKCKNGAPPKCIDGERKANLFFLKASIIKTFELWVKNDFENQLSDSADGSVC